MDLRRRRANSRTDKEWDRNNSRILENAVAYGASLLRGMPNPIRRRYKNPSGGLMELLIPVAAIAALFYFLSKKPTTQEPEWPGPWPN